MSAVYISVYLSRILKSGEDDPVIELRSRLPFFYSGVFHPFRLYSKGIFVSHRRGKRNIHAQQSLVKIDGVYSKEETNFYLGKRLAYVYRVHKRGKGKLYMYIELASVDRV